MLLEIYKPTLKILQKNKNKNFNGTRFISVKVARKHFAPGNHLKNCLCKVFFCLTNLITFKIQFTFGAYSVKKTINEHRFLIVLGTSIVFCCSHSKYSICFKGALKCFFLSGSGKWEAH